MEFPDAMLLSSILRLLEQRLAQPGVVKKPEPQPGYAAIAAAQEASGLKKIELEIAAAAGLLRPIHPDPQLPGANLAGPALEELLRTIADLKKSDQSRFVDVFE
jgi:hypothetical protein